MSFLRMCILCTIIRCWESPHTLFSHLPLHLLLLFNSSSLMALLRLHLFHCSIHFSFRCHLSHQVADLTDHLTGEAYPTPNRSVDDEECSIYSACSLCAANNCADSSERRLEWHSAGSEGQVVALTWRPNSACHTRCCHHWLHLICFMVRVGVKKGPFSSILLLGGGGGGSPDPLVVKDY